MFTSLPYSKGRDVGQFYPEPPLSVGSSGDMWDRIGARGELKNKLKAEMEETLVRNRLQSLINNEAEMNAMRAAASSNARIVIAGMKPHFVHRMGNVIEKSYFSPGLNQNLVTSRWRMTRGGRYLHTTPFDRNPSPDGIARVFGLSWESPFARI